MGKNMEVKGTKPSEMVSSDATASVCRDSHMLIIQHLAHHFITRDLTLDLGQGITIKTCPICRFLLIQIKSCCWKMKEGKGYMQCL